MKKSFFAVSSFFVCFLGYAQPNYDFQQLKADHHGENAVIIKNNRSYEIGLKKGELAITSTSVLGFTILEDKARISSEHEVSYAPGFYEIDDLEASSYVLQSGNKYKRIKVKNFDDYSDYSGSVFYDDTRHRKFYFPNLKEGTYAEVSHTYTYLRPQFLGGYFFQPGSWSTVESNLTVVVEEGIDIAFSVFGDTSGIAFTQSTEGGKTTYVWSKKNSPSTKYFYDAPPSRYYVPHIFVRVNSYTYKGKTTQVLENTTDLYHFNHDFLKEVNKVEPSAGIKHVVDSLKAINPTTDTLIQNIFYWVQNNIKYIAIEDGLGGYVPRQANDIYANKYGDCKDKSSIITCMLNAAGIPSNLVWIGSRDLPYRYEDLPTPNVDNHMIAAVNRNNKWIFLDGTASHVQYGYPTNFIQGKEALIAIDKDSFTIAKVPVVPARENRMTDSMFMRIENGVILAQGRVQVEKMQKFRITQILLNMKEEDRTKRLEDLNRKGNNKCEVESMEVFHFSERNMPLQLKYSIKIPDYVRDIDNNLYVNMWLSKSYVSAKIDTVKRNGIPKEVEYTYTDHQYYELEIPKGYTLDATELPAPIDYHKGSVQLNYSYKVVENKILFDYQFAVDTLLIEEAQFSDWNDAIDLLNKAYGEVIVLKKQP